MVNPITWVLSPIAAVIVAALAISVSGGPGLDGAARSTAVVFWFLPTICWLGYRSLAHLRQLNLSKIGKVLLVLVWLIPAVPLSLMSLYGMMLLSDTGFGVLFR